MKMSFVLKNIIRLGVYYEEDWNIDILLSLVVAISRIACSKRSD